MAKTRMKVVPSSYNLEGNKMKIIFKIDSTVSFKVNREECDQMLEDLCKAIKNIMENYSEFCNPLNKL